VAFLRITQGGSFTYIRGLQLYLSHRVAVIPVTQGGSFTYKAGWHFYV